MFCPQCGNEIPDQSVFCPKCGSNVKPKSAPAPESAAPAGFQPQQAPAGFQPQQPPMAGQAVPAPVPPAPKKSKLPMIIAIIVAAAVVAALCICIPKCAGGGKAVDKDGNITPAAVQKNTTIEKIQKLAADNGYTIYDQGTMDGSSYFWFEESDELEDDFQIYANGDDIVLAQFYVDVQSPAGFRDYIKTYCNCKNISYYDCNGDGQADALIADTKLDGKDAIMTAQLDSDGLATIAIIDDGWINEYLENYLGSGYLDELSALGVNANDLRDVLEYFVVYEEGGVEL